MTNQEAIRELMFAKREVLADSFIDKAYDMAISALKAQLPSAQPDNRLSKIADLVEGTIDHFDLDDAMDLLYQIKDVLDGSDELPSAQTNLDRIYAELSKAYNVPGLPEEAIGIIGDLMVSLDEPSAQPERTCVNCGRTVNNGGWYADGGTRCPIEEHYALPKDGYCHLWEKRNVTDDDYPERREE